MMMTIHNQLANHFRTFYFGGNWTATSFQDVISDVTWQEAKYKLDHFHTIGELVYHIHYFLRVVIPVLEGGILDANDRFSFDVPDFLSEQDWLDFLNQMWVDARHFAHLLESQSDSILADTFVDDKYGTYFRNMLGIIEHGHYHLGQIVILKKIIRNRQYIKNAV